MSDAERGEMVRGEPGLVCFLRLGWRRARFLLTVSGLAGALTLGLALLMPKWYEARAVVLPPHETQSPLVALRDLSASLQLESVLPFSAGVTLFDVYLAILNSDTVARSLVERFDLREHYRKPLLVRALARLRALTTIAAGRNRIIEIRVEDKDPRVSADLANAYVDELDRVFRETRSSAGRRQREFLEARLKQARADLDSAQAALVEVEAKVGLTTLSRDLTDAALAAGDLIGRRLALSVQLEMLDALGVKDAPARQALETELRAVESEAARLPGFGLEVARRLRDVRIQETLGDALAQQLEAARIEEVRNTPAVEVLDRALPPDRHSRPRKGLMAAAGALAGLGLAFAWAVYRDPPRGR